MSKTLARHAVEWVPTLLFLLLLLAARSTLADHYRIPSGSMENSLFPGDRVAVDKRVYGWELPFTDIEFLSGRPPQRGEIVIFDSPEDGTRLIKRVAAVGGDRITLLGGRLTVNGEPMAASLMPDAEQFGERIALLNLKYGGGKNIAELRVPDGHLYMLGDARGNSRDSRFFGLIPESALYGRAIAVYYRSGEGFEWLRL